MKLKISSLCITDRHYLYYDTDETSVRPPVLFTKDNLQQYSPSTLRFSKLSLLSLFVYHNSLCVTFLPINANCSSHFNLLIPMTHRKLKQFESKLRKPCTTLKGVQYCHKGEVISKKRIIPKCGYEAGNRYQVISTS